MSEIKTLSIDLETYSSADLPKCGVYKYVESPDFDILLFGYSVNEEPVRVIDVACGEKIPESVLKMLTDDSVEKWAYNAQFERIKLSISGISYAQPAAAKSVPAAIAMSYPGFRSSSIRMSEGSKSN